MQQYLDRAIAAARAGADVIISGAAARSTLTVISKKPNDFVSEIDRNAERAIIDTLHAAFPDHAILAEESGQSGGSDHTWIIDPLDGTTNFLHGIPHHCISIALRRETELIAGVVFDAVNDRMFTATKGGGSRLNGEAIRVSERGALEGAVIGTGFPFTDWSYLDDYLASLREIMLRTAGIRRPGAAALDLAYVAAGWVDGHWETNLNPWDMAAAMLLITEAGGVVSDFAGRTQELGRRNIVAGSAGVHGALLDVLRHYPGLDF